MTKQYFQFITMNHHHMMQSWVKIYQSIVLMTNLLHTTKQCSLLVDLCLFIYLLCVYAWLSILKCCGQKNVDIKFNAFDRYELVLTVYWCNLVKRATKCTSLSDVNISIMLLILFKCLNYGQVCSILTSNSFLRVKFRGQLKKKCLSSSISVKEQ